MRTPPKLALLISSFRRPVDLIRQVISMVKGQSYPHATALVSVKGISEYVMKSLIIPQLSPFVEEGKVRLRWDGNSSQLVNLLDTMKGVDPDEFELYLKIDDDDFYSPEYLRIVAQALQMAPRNASTYLHGNFPGCDASPSLYPTFPPNSYFTGWGDLLGISPLVMKHVLSLFRSYQKLARDLERNGIPPPYDLGASEDRYLFSLMRNLSPAVDITSLFEAEGVTPVIVGTHTKETSITRGAFASSFFHEVRFVTRGYNHLSREFVIEDESGVKHFLFRGVMYREMKGGGREEIGVYREFKNGRILMANGEGYKRLPSGRYAKT